MYNKYINKKHQLKDNKIIQALRKAAEDYENGEIAEVRDVLADIVEAIDEFSENYAI